LSGRGADEVFDALADPTRRRLLRAVVEHGPVTATELASDLPISRQAVAKHLGVLRGAGLVATRRSGRETHYDATPDRLQAAADWIDATGSAWDRRLERLKRHLQP
jgi:DNA-binding transcriptional ArsR family regulator